MSANKITIEAKNRITQCHRELQSLRLSGLVPANLYSHGKSQKIAVPVKSLPKEHTKANLITLQLEGAPKTVLMREVQVHPISQDVLHIDFQEVIPTDKVKVHIPLEFVGLTREQEKEGSFKTLLRSLEVRGEAAKLPQTLKVKVGHLKVDESAHISDVEVGAGLTILAKKNLALASLVRI